MSSTIEEIKIRLLQVLDSSSISSKVGVSPVWLAALSIAFNPIYWNFVARTEYRFKIGRRVLGPYLGCYLLAISIFLLGLVRDHFFLQAIEGTPTDLYSHNTKLLVQSIGGGLFLAGNVLVVSSMYALGVTGTYLGDYFGILMDARVTGFPFSITNNPMYYGSVLSFLGTSLWYGKSVGLLLTGEVLVMYLLALRFEEPYTAEIYAARDRQTELTSSKTQ